MIVVGWPGSTLVARLAAELGARAVTLDLHRFPDDEALVRVDPAVEGEDVVFAVSLDHADEKFLPLAFAADAASELGAHSVMLAAPYLAYMRQDLRFHNGEAVSSRTFAELLSSRFDAIATVDPHLHRWHTLREIYSMPSRVASAAPAIGAWLRQNVERPLVIGPDAESAQWVAQVAAIAGAPHAVMEKVRTGDREVAVRLEGPLPAGRFTPVLVDDIISSGMTLAAAAGYLAEHGFDRPVAICVHALFGEGAAMALRAAGIERLATCDTIDHPTNAITIVPALANAVRELSLP